MYVAILISIIQEYPAALYFKNAQTNWSEEIFHSIIDSIMKFVNENEIFSYRKKTIWY